MSLKKEVDEVFVGYELSMTGQQHNLRLIDGSVTTLICGANFPGTLVNLCSHVPPGGRDDGGAEREHGQHRPDPQAASGSDRQVKRTSGEVDSDRGQVGQLRTKLPQRQV